MCIKSPDVTTSAGKSRLTFELHDPVKGIYPLYFETDSRYGQYLVSELSDSCVVCVLLYAMENDYDIRCEGAISERLYNQLTSYFIPAISRNIPHYRKINIICETSNAEFHPQAVGAAMSCGVDSFYTALKNLQHPQGSSLRITHLCLFNDGSAGNDGEKSRRLWAGRAENDRRAAAELGCEFLTCDSNANEFLMQDHLKTHTTRTLAFVLALQKLFSVYYFSSTFPFSKFHFTEKDPAYYDIFTLSLLSTQNVRFELVGGETTRLGKVAYITQYDITRKYLNVCVGCTVENDSTCGKCVRTMLELYLLGKLDDYSSVFDTELFRRKKKRYIYEAIMQRNNPDIAEVLCELKRRNEIGVFGALVYVYVFIHPLVKRLAKRILPEKAKNFLKKLLRKK